LEIPSFSFVLGELEGFQVGGDRLFSTIKPPQEIRSN
jgi:hypothetical protein